MRKRAAVALCAALVAHAPVLAQSGASSVGTISGEVFDSLSLRPMARAVVQLARLGAGGRVEGTWSAATDSGGRYAFEPLPLGSYLLGFQHLAIDTLGLRSPVHRVDLRRGGAVHVALGAPTMRSVVEKVCGDRAAKDSISLLVGSVRDASTDRAIDSAFVSVRWAEVYLTRAGMVRETRRHDLTTSSEGWYMACVPSGVPVTIHGEHADRRSGDVELTVSTLALLRRDLYVGQATVSILTATDSVRTSGAVNEGDRLLSSGTGVIRGTVRRLDGAPLTGARVTVSGTRGEARTDGDGRFVLRAVPHGSHMVEARALGYVPGEAAVDIVAFQDNPMTITLMDVESVLLDTVRVRAQRSLTLALRAGFERRRKSGVGMFIDERVLDTLKSNTFSDVVRRVPGIIFREGRGSNEGFERQMFLSGGGRSEPCQPVIYLDGMRLLQRVTDLDQLIAPGTIRRVEVYLRGTTPPAEFASFSDCGIVVVWTTPRTPEERRR